jgi:dTDP-4-amino-4,6-dideoxygalactose transaminase
MENKFNRRAFVGASSLIGAGLLLEFPNISLASGSNVLKPAILGGPKAHEGMFPGWPVMGQPESKSLEEVLQSKKWCRLGSNKVANFETEYKKVTGAAHVLATSSGTSALLTLLGALDIGPGDEVIIPVYTFIATYNVVVLNYALPIFVDTDIESFQIDANKIEAAITPQTKVIMPVHMGGSPANLDKILEL